MHINPNTSGNLPHLSPIFSSNNLSPYLSPLNESPLRKPSDDQINLFNFSLEPEDQHFQHQNQYFREDLAEPFLLQQPLDKFESEQPAEASEIVSINPNEMKEQKVIPTKSTFPLGGSQIQMVIEFLVENSKLPEEALMKQGQSLYEGSKDLCEVFRILMPKFKKLKKTKEEMVKYCMRKAFKFIIDKGKKDKKNTKDIDNCMKKYFQSSNCNSNISIPFKKNSSQKTMNGNFLKKVFAESQFVSDYKQFVVQFPSLIVEDNQKKIKYLAETIDQYLSAENIKVAHLQQQKIQSIKRLPWTKQILNRTEDLSKNLLEFAEENQIKL